MNTAWAAVSARREYCCGRCSARTEAACSHIALCLCLLLQVLCQQKENKGACSSHSSSPLFPTSWPAPCLPGFSEQCRQCEQPDNWCCEQDEERSTWCSQQDTQRMEQPEALLDGGSQWPTYSMWYRVATILSVGSDGKLGGSGRSLDSMKRRYRP